MSNCPCDTDQTKYSNRNNRSVYDMNNSQIFDNNDRSSSIAPDRKIRTQTSCNYFCPNNRSEMDTDMNKVYGFDSVVKIGVDRSNMIVKQCSINECEALRNVRSKQDSSMMDMFNRQDRSDRSV